MKNKGILFIFLLLIILFLVNIFEASGQTITDYENMSVLKDFYYCNSDESYYAYVSSSQYNSGAFKINGGSTYNEGENVNKRDYDQKYTISANKTGYLKINGTTLSFIDNAGCPISYLDFIANNVMTIPPNITVNIPPNAEVALSNIIFQGESGINYGRLINNGHLEITESFNFLNGTFENNGILDFYGDVNFICPYSYCNGEQAHPWHFINKAHGYIFLNGDKNFQHHFNVGNPTCGQISFGPNDYNLLYFEEGSSLESNYYDISINTNNGETNLQTFTVKNGDVEIHIDSNAGVEAETLIVDGTITFSGGQYQSVNIEKFGMFDFVNNSSASQYLNINAAEGANIFVKQITYGTPIFTIKNKASMTLCQNPTKGVADWENSNLATLEAGGTFNYIIDEYTINGKEYNPTNKKLFSSLDGEGDINTPDNITIELQRYGKTIDENSGIRITSFVQFIRYIISLLSTRDGQKVYLNGAFTDMEECEDTYNNHKSEILPIELTYFKITDGNFEWETKSETNNDYFIIEYSKNGTDWTECTDHIQSQSNTGWIYSYPVPETTKGSVFSYYRLKQVDLDGTFSYSDILSTSWKVPTPPQPKAGYTKAFIGIDGKIIYDNYNQLPSGVYIEKSENGTRRIVKLK